MATMRNLGTRSLLEAGMNPILRVSIGVSGIDAKPYVYTSGGNCGDCGSNDNI